MVYGTKDTEENDAGDINGEIVIMTAVAACGPEGRRNRETARWRCNEGGARKDEKDGREEA